MQSPLNTVVVPYVGTWIEILINEGHQTKFHVVPYVGTWIEMNMKERSFEN